MSSIIPPPSFSLLPITSLSAWTLLKPGTDVAIQDVRRYSLWVLTSPVSSSVLLSFTLSPGPPGPQVSQQRVWLLQHQQLQQENNHKTWSSHCSQATDQAQMEENTHKQDDRSCCFRRPRLTDPMFRGLSVPGLRQSWSGSGVRVKIRIKVTVTVKG